MANHGKEEWIGDFGMVLSTGISGIASFYSGKTEIVIETFSVLTDLAFSFTRDATDKEGLTTQEIESIIIGAQSGWIAGTLTTRGLTAIGGAMAGPIGAGIALMVGDAASKLFDFYSGNYDQRSWEEIYNLQTVPPGSLYPNDYSCGAVHYDDGSCGDPAEAMARASLYQMILPNAATAETRQDFERNLDSGMDPNEALNLALEAARQAEADGGNAFRPGYTAQEAQDISDAKAELYDLVPDNWKENPAAAQVVGAFNRMVENGGDPAAALAYAQRLLEIHKRHGDIQPDEEETTGGGREHDDKDDRDDHDDATDHHYGTTYDPTKVVETGGGKKTYEPYDSGGVKYDTYKGGAMMPIILDLDGDGIEFEIGEDIYFDMDDDGFLEQTSRAAADDGFLVIDLNADGTRGAGDGDINQSNELVLSTLGEDGDTDLQALGRHDDNGDGKLTAADAIWNELKVWYDIDKERFVQC